jgi:hypothetical protein
LIYVYLGQRDELFKLNAENSCKLYWIILISNVQILKFFAVKLQILAILMQILAILIQIMAILMQILTHEFTKLGLSSGQSCYTLLGFH